MMTRRHFRFFVFYPFAVITVLTVMLWMATPLIAKYALKQYIEQQGNEVKIGRLSVDFFPPKIDIRRLAISDTEKEAFALEKATFEIAFWPLFGKRLHITEANIQGLMLDVAQRENDWIIAGINTAQYLTPNAPQQSEPDEAIPQQSSTAWSIKLPSFALSNSQIYLSRQADLALPVKTDTFKVSRILLEEVLGQGVHWQGKLAFSGGINTATLAFNSQFDYSPTQANGHFELEKAQFSIDSLRHFLPSSLIGNGEFLASGYTALTQVRLENDLTQFSLKDLELSLQAAQLDVEIDDHSYAATADTQVLINNSQLSYRTDNAFSAQGHLNIDSTQTHLGQDNDQVQFNQFTLSLPFNLQHDDDQSALNTSDTQLDLSDFLVVFDDVSVSSKALHSTASLKLNKKETTSVTGQLALNTKQTQVTQLDHQFAVEQLTFDLPIVLQHNESTTTLDISKTPLLLTNMLASFNGTTIENARFDGALENLSASLGSDGTIDATFLSQIDSQDFSYTQPASATLGNDAPTTVAFNQLTFSSPITLRQTDLGLKVYSQDTQLNVNTLALSSDELDLENQRVNLSLNDLFFALNQDSSLEASATSHLQSQALSLTQAGNRVSYEKFTLSNRTALQQSVDAIAVQNTQLELRMDDFDAVLSDEKNLSFKNVLLTANTLNVEQNTQQPLLVSGSQVDVSTELFDIKLTHEKRLASWNNASIADLSFSQQSEDFKVSFAQFDMANLTLSEVLNKVDTSLSLPPLSHISHVNIGPLTATQKGVDIQQVTLGGLKVNLLLNKTKQLDNLVFVAGEAANQPDENQRTEQPVNAEQRPSTEQNSTPEPSLTVPYYVILDSLDTVGDSSIYVRDASIPATLQRTLTIETLSVKDLNTQNKDQETLFKAVARHGRYTTLNTETKIIPMADKLTLNTVIVLREAELPPYSPYISNVLGYQIDSGQLNLDLNLDINNGILNGQTQIILREFDLGGRQESNSMIRAGAVPLNIAVGMLKDANNNIELDIPLRGDIENPSFGWQNFLLLPLRRALYSASTNYLMQTFIPYANVISIAQFAGEQLLRIRVEPLFFDAQQSEPSDSNAVFLAQLVALMKDRKDSQLKACGVTSFQDLGQEQPSSVLDDDTRAFAINLAQQRAENLKDFLVNEGIESSRVFLCSPEIDLSRNSKPRVELNF